jgi:hypothetical protein
MHQRFHMHRAEPVPQLAVTVRARRELVFPESAPALWPHVRAASGICWFEGRLHIVQDDASSIARLTPEPFALDSVSLPTRSDGALLFDARTGNKQHKPDLESCVARRGPDGPRLFGIGSGSGPARTALLSARPFTAGLACAWVEVPALYAALASHPGFLSSELNIEGALDLGTHLRLFQRSNGVPLAQTPPVCASVDLPWDALLAYLDGTCADLPPISGLRHYVLPSIEGVRLTITCAQRSASGDIFLLASAEASPNAHDDGVVLGSAVGKVRGDTIRWGLLCDESGAVLREKAEGMAEKPGAPQTFFVVFDPDDADRPALLAELHVDDLVAESPPNHALS